MTTEQIISRRAFPITVVLLILSLAFIFFLLRSNGENKEAHDRDREILISAAKANQEKAQAKFDSIAIKLVNDSTVQAKRDSVATVKETRLTIEIRHWKRLRNEAGVKIDTFTVVIEAKSDSLRTADSLQIVALKQDKLTLKLDYTGQVEAMTTKYLEQVTISDRWEGDAKDAEKKLTRMEKIAAWLGVSTATLAVVVTILAIAL